MPIYFREIQYDTILCERMSEDDTSQYMYNPEKALTYIETEHQAPPLCEEVGALIKANRKFGKSAKRLSYG